MLKYLFCFVVLSVIFAVAENLEVSTEIAPVRKNNSSKSDIVKILKNGDKFTLEQADGEWYKISFGEPPVSGWINRNLVRPVYETSIFADSVVLKDGKIYVGRIIKETPRIVIVDKAGENMDVRRHLVKKVVYVTAGQNSRTKFPGERLFSGYANYLETEKNNIAVMNFKSIGLSQSQARTVTDE
ncbi:MAG: SH3 domain-containing protein [bacterium]